MAGRFLLRRSALAREQAQQALEVSAQRISTLVALVTTLADRMEAMPSRGLDHDRDRLARVAVLRATAEAGTRSLAAGAANPDGGQREASG